jgi:hypothetical protein
MSTKLASIVFVIFLLSPRYVPGRTVEEWPMERLMRESDLVVVARPLSSKDIVDGGAPREDGLVSVKTTLDVEVVLKGRADGRKVSLIHFRSMSNDEVAQLPPNTIVRGMINGPLLIDFGVVRNGSQKSGHGSLEAPVHPISRESYVLFLKGKAGGDYYPTAGLADPAFSVYHLRVADGHAHRK